MFRKIGDWFRNLMIGRYGQDQLGTAMFYTGFVSMIIGMFLRRFLWSSVFSLISWVALIWCMVRIYSRNIEARSRENKAYLDLLTRLRDKEHRYFRCPACRQRVRVPRGRGRISITCPKCAQKFIKKS